MEDTQKRLKEVLSKSASEEEMLLQLSLAEGCGLKVFCEQRIVPGTERKIHRWYGYITHCDDPAESIPETVYGARTDGGCPEK
jgi:hypothetical protein